MTDDATAAVERLREISKRTPGIGLVVDSDDARAILAALTRAGRPE